MASPLKTVLGALQEWWQNPEEVDLVQFMGKDNVPFHTIIFPASQIGTRERWTQMKNISVTEYLNYEGRKFSKTNGVGVFGNDAKDTGIPVEVPPLPLPFPPLSLREDRTARRGMAIQICLLTFLSLTTSTIV